MIKTTIKQLKNFPDTYKADRKKQTNKHITMIEKINMII